VSARDNGHIDGRSQIYVHTDERTHGGSQRPNVIYWFIFISVSPVIAKYNDAIGLNGMAYSIYSMKQRCQRLNVRPMWPPLLYRPTDRVCATALASVRPVGLMRASYILVVMVRRTVCRRQPWADPTRNHSCILQRDDIVKTLLIREGKQSARSGHRCDVIRSTEPCLVGPLYPDSL